ncbi:MAG: triose-phosphate isomerase [Patescibacteria group bacterium]
MPKKPYIIANWKMNLEGRSVERFFGHFQPTAGQLESAQIVICPSFVFIDKVKRLIGGRPIAVGGQDISLHIRGAFTGEVSAEQLQTAGASQVIIGHSERRYYFHETDEMINQKVRLALQFGLSPILCIGENAQEKEDGLTKKVVERQLHQCLAEVRSHEIRRILIAYEPVWAISTSPDNPGGVADTPESAQVVHRYVRTVIRDLYDEHTAVTQVIVYGGSVSPDNVNGFTRMDDIDGILVGGASKDAASFQKILNQVVNT